MVSSGLLREWDLRALSAVIEDGLRDHPGPVGFQNSATGV
jgi:hypothetical protein